MEIPVYLFAGFLDSGKTDFINGILEEGFAREEGETLLICCEEGENEYPENALDCVTVVHMEDEETLTRDFLKQCEKKYRPKQVLIEYNGMWLMERLYREVLPSNWMLYQIVTTVEAGTFEVYAKNMGQLMMEKIANADIIIFNRCTPELAAALRKRNLRMVNRRAEVFLEMEDGSSEDYYTGEECPFDLSAQVVEIPDEDYGVWYVDVMEHPERYVDKLVRMKTVVCHVPKYPNVSVLGRFAMVCCADDVTFLGLVSRGEGLDGFENRDWAEVTARITLEEHPAYGAEPGPVMNVIAIFPSEGAEEDVVSF